MSNQTNIPVATPREVCWEEWLWQRCLAPKTSLVLFALIVLVLLVGQLIPQLPDDARSDPAAYDRWLQTVPTLLRRLEAILSRLGLFDIQRSLWFQTLLVVAATVSLVTLGAYLDALFRPRQVLLHHLSSQKESMGLPISEALVAIVVQTVSTLIGPPYQAVAGNRAAVYARRPRWAQPLAMLTCLGLLLTVLGILLDVHRGWMVSAVALPPQTVVRITPSQTLSLASFERTPPQAKLYVGHGARRTRITVGENKATLTGGLSCRVVGTGGLYVQVRAVDRDGTSLDLYPYVAQPEPVQTLTRAFSVEETQDSVVFFILSQNIVAQLSWGGQSELQLVLSNDVGQRLSVHTLPVSDGTFEVDNTGLQIEITFYPTLALSYRPGRWLLLMGVLLVVVGGVFDAIPVQTLWVEVAGEAEQIVVRIRQTPGVEKNVRQIETIVHTLGMSLEHHPVEEQ